MKTFITIGLVLAITSALPAGAEEEIELLIAPEDPHVFPGDGPTISVLPEAIPLGRGEWIGTVQITLGDSVIDLNPGTVVAAGGHLYKFRGPFRFTTGNRREEDMIFTIVNSCALTVVRTDEEAPAVKLAALEEALDFDCSNRILSQQKTVFGEDNHFVTIQVFRAEISRSAPSNVLGAAFQLNVVNHAGGTSLRLGYMDKQEITLGDETITLESFDFDYDAKSIKIRVQTESEVEEAESTIVYYGELGR